MTTVTIQDTPVNLQGHLPEVGNKAPEFYLTSCDLKDIHLSQFQGKYVILNIYPSIDTPVCATSVRKFNAQADKLPKTVIICVSQDLPFAQKRFCGLENIRNLITASAFRFPEFGKDYGVTLIDGPLKGLFARAVFVINPQGHIIHRELVPKIEDEPDYQTAVTAIQKDAAST